MIEVREHVFVSTAFTSVCEYTISGVCSMESLVVIDLLPFSAIVLDENDEKKQIYP